VRNLTARAQAWIFARHMRQQVRPERFGAFGDGSFLAPPFTCDFPHNLFIGERVHIHEYAWISCPDNYLGKEHPNARVEIGSRTRFGRDLTISCNGHVRIGEDVMCSDRILIADTNHGYEDIDTPIRDQPLADPRPVTIEDGVHIGVGGMVMAGVTIGRNSLIGAGAVVTSDVPANAVAVGNPARVVRYYDHERGEWVSGSPPGERPVTGIG
jgi:acetyltransferase-like isoleucine patch superfamily enzyme